MKTADLIKYAGALAAVAFSGCDDGKIWPSSEDLSGDNGMTVVMTADISGAGSSYEGGYTLALAAFEEGNDFAVVSKTVGDGSEPVEIRNVSPSVSTVELCVVSSIRKRVATLASVSVEGAPGARVDFDAGSVDASLPGVIENSIFATTCVQCHGATGHSAAGLDLRPGEARKMLAGVPSAVVEGALRVAPGDASASTLWQAVATDASENWKFHHNNLLTSDQCGLIEHWIGQLEK